MQYDHKSEFLKVLFLDFITKNLENIIPSHVLKGSDIKLLFCIYYIDTLGVAQKLELFHYLNLGKLPSNTKNDERSS